MSPVVDRALAKSHGLDDAEYDLILSRLGRVPTLEELGMISVMWSEHCSYKSSRIHLAKLPTQAAWVLQGPGENAGVIDVGEGLAVAFKMESHNHPSFIEPYQGAATGVGGIMRDVFTMGARPIASLNSLRFGDPAAPRMRALVEGVVAGIGGYGNCMGVPTVGGEIAFDPSYNGNILVNAMNIGVLPADRIFRSAAAGVGNAVVYVGSKTGRDGIHGATMASEEFGKDSEAKRPRVQVGDPFTEKKLLEACLELMREDVIIAIQDMGAAGLTSSSCEMASKGEVGIDIDVARVPRREPGMTPYEVLLSESQERMLMVIKEGGAPTVERIFAKWDLDAAIIGHITDTGQVVVRDGDRVVVTLPASVLADDAPKYDRPRAAPADLEARWVLPALPPRDAGARLLSLVARPTIASKRWVYEQYDWSVRCATVLGPGAADAAVLRLPALDGSPTSASQRGIGAAVDMNGRYCQLDPRRGAALGVLECARNLVCTGVTPRAVTDCLNFGNPQRPEVMWSLAEAIEGIREACVELDTPIVSGNVSLYNETEGRPILPTPTVGMVGVIDDVRRAVGAGFGADGDAIVLLGAPESASLAGSELQLAETGRLAGRPPAIDWDTVRAVHGTCLEAITSGLVSSAHDVSEGGVAVAVAESAILGGRGARLNWERRDEALLFAEGPSLIILSVPKDRLDAVLGIARKRAAPIKHLGEVGGDRVRIQDMLDVALSELTAAWRGGLTAALGIADGSRESSATGVTG